MSTELRAGVYRHYKGNHYLALGLAREDESEDLVVVYTRLYARAGLPLSTRRLAAWNQPVHTPNGPVPRFEYVGLETPTPLEPANPSQPPARVD